MTPVFLVMHWRPTLLEQQEVEAEMGNVYRRYAVWVPRIVPWRRVNIGYEA